MIIEGTGHCAGLTWIRGEGGFWTLIQLQWGALMAVGRFQCTIIAQNLICSWLTYLYILKFILLHKTTKNGIMITKNYYSVSIIMDFRRIIQILHIRCTETYRRYIAIARHFLNCQFFDIKVKNIICITLKGKIKKKTQKELQLFILRI